MTVMSAGLVTILFAMLVGCARGTPDYYVKPSPEYAESPPTEGEFYQLESFIRTKHGADVSGFELLDTDAEALSWRLALIDSARQSIDVQYYLWQADDAARLITKRLLDAADRGVRVRMIVDDINTILGEDGAIAVRDEAAAWVNAHPNFEVRLFNPWSDRKILARVKEALGKLKQLNQRMHNKAMIVDNRAVILGGRNIGNQYFGLSPDYNFRDLDVLSIGPVSRQVSAVFDAYWNSAWVVPVSQFEITVTESGRSQARDLLEKRVREAKSLVNFPADPKSWSTDIAALRDRMHFGPSRVASDLPAQDKLNHVMLEEIHAMMATPQTQLLIMNAYIIPAERGINALQKLHDRGVETKILTNSLASHDVPAVNSHYKQWRKPILEAGAQLYEIRHDAAIQSTVVDTPPIQAEFMGLHAKAMVVDRSKVFIGSMNFDPRSAQINTEMGVFIESSSLAEAMAKVIERDMEPANSWRVELTPDGDLRWANDEETVTSQPARSWWQRVQDVLFMAAPKSLY